MTGSESDKFCLRWNEFESNLSSAIQEVESEKCLYDVTVACDGGGEFPAHRLVLSACSLVLRQVLCRKSQLGGGLTQHQVVYLRGVTSQDLKFILSFMYQGEVSLAQHQLNSFLAVAEDLQVKGLIQKESERMKPAAVNRKDESGAKPRSEYISSSRTAAPVTRPQQEESIIENDEIQEIPAVKAEPYQAEHPGVSGGGQLMAAEDSDLMYNQDSYGGGGADQMLFDEGVSQGLDQDPATLIQYIARDETTGQYQCSLCSDFSHKSRANVRNHVESKHFQNTFVYSCSYCDKTCTSHQALLKHKSVFHKNK